jgi:hypothetical protein
VEDDTGWKPILVEGGDGAQYAKGRVEMVTGVETRPCLNCRSWEKDDRRLIEYFLAKGLTQLSDGTFETPIAKDVPGRKSLVIDPASWGFCRRQSIATDMLASCEDFQPVRTAAELQSRIKP